MEKQPTREGEADVFGPDGGQEYASLHQTFEQQHMGNGGNCRAALPCVSECGAAEGKAIGRPFHRSRSEGPHHQYLHHHHHHCWPRWHWPVGNTVVSVTETVARIHWHSPFMGNYSDQYNNHYCLKRKKLGIPWVNLITENSKFLLHFLKNNELYEKTWKMPLLGRKRVTWAALVCIRGKASHQQCHHMHGQ